MTLWALVSDVHGRGDRLARVLADSRAQGAERLLALGDIAGGNALDQLRQADASCVFGNWEASGLRGLPAPFRSWVSRWPARMQLDGFVIAHATPVWPEGLAISRVVDYLRDENLYWTQLFPSLQRSEEARWAAFAELDALSIPLFFHGHTHVQEAWCWAPPAAPRRVTPEPGEIRIAEGERWLVGVGSAGEPHDGQGACYALYDSAAQVVRWRRV